jgi:geranylgeranyl diphosphate synthase type II
MANCPVTSSEQASATCLPADQGGSIAAALESVRDFIEPRLAASLAFDDNTPPRLAEAIRYAVLAPGKRLRPALALWAAQACGDPHRDPADHWEAATPAAIAVECIHAYSLVHDDLPAMDDDDLRRGRPTCHRAFDEATAILCGDALQPLAFEILSSGMPTAVAARACLTLARAAGAAALVGGQVDDLAAERGWIAGPPATAAEQVAWMDRINRRKTGALFLASLQLGGLAVEADAAQLEALIRFGRAFGMAFQIADDLLDAAGTEAAMGKRVGKDAQRGKLTYPTVAGMGAARDRAQNLAAEAAAAVAPLGEPAARLAALAHWIVARDH